jgi:hypothetical protein
MFEMSVYRIYTNECISIIISLSDILPSELIQVIIRSYWSLHSEPVLLSLTSEVTRDLVADVGFRKYSALSKILEINPNLRRYPIHDFKFYISSYEKSKERIPKAIHSRISWLSVIYLIPGPLWDYATLYPDSETINTDSMQCCNVTSKGKITATLGEYKIADPDEVLRWFKDSVNHPDFIAAQNLSL